MLKVLEWLKRQLFKKKESAAMTEELVIAPTVPALKERIKELDKQIEEHND